MLHHTARALPERLLFTSWIEAAVLWDCVVRAAPGLQALCLMPDHLHLLHEADLRLRLAAALSGYTRWLNRRRGPGGPLLRPLEAPDRALEGDKQRRSIRYVHLNPCRARLVADPLAWPFSTHRDAVGMAAFPVVPRRSDAPGFHRYVSSDPTVHVDGTELPTISVAVPDAGQVLHATSAVARAPVLALSAHGRARALFVRAARTLTPASHGEIAEAVGVHRKTVLRARPGEDATIRTIARAVADPRFPPLFDADLRSLLAWSRYRERL